MFKSASVIGSLSGSAALGPEAIAGELAILGAIIAFRKIKQKVQDKRQRKDDQSRMEQQQQEEQKAAEDQWLEIENQRQEAARQAEIQRQQAEQERQRQAEIQRQQGIADQQNVLNQQRLNENQQDIQRAEYNAQRVEDQVEGERERRIQLSGRSVYVSGYPGQNDAPAIASWLFSPAMLQVDDEPAEEWRLISGDYIPGFDEYRQGLDPPPPDDPNGGNGNGGDPSGPNNPRGDPNGGFPNPRNPVERNPYQDIIRMISISIQKEKNDEKKSVEDLKKEDEDRQEQIVGKDGAGTWKPEYQTDEYKQQHQDDTANYPGKNGGGIYNPSPIQKEDPTQSFLDNQHIAQQELEAIIMAQGEQELTSEEQLVELMAIDQKLNTLLPAQVKVTGIYAQQIRKY